MVVFFLLIGFYTFSHKNLYVYVRSYKPTKKIDVMFNLVSKENRNVVNYSLESCESVIEKYVNEYNGMATTLEEGVLGLGKMILHSAKGKKVMIITEYYINAWESGHKVRQYNKMPKKYEKLLEKII